MKLTAKFIEDKLNEKFLNKKVGYGTWDIESGIRSILSEYAKENKISDSYFRVQKESSSNWTVNFYYRGYLIGTVDIKRAKGEHHHSYWGNGYNDWTYKSFGVWMYKSDTEAYFIEVDQLVEKANKAADDKLTVAQGVVDVISEMIDKSGYELRNYIEYLYKNRYTLIH